MEILGKQDHLRLRALFEMATDGIITMNGRGIMENVNRAACELFGYAAEELIGQKVNKLMGEHDRHHHDTYLERYARTRQPHIIGIGREVTGRRKDGTLFPLRLAVSEVQLDDGVLYTGILHDLTEFHRAQQRVWELNQDLEQKVVERTTALREREAELRQALGKERELSELKSRFLSMASHEFKTPLSTVLSSAELIELYRTEEQQPKRTRHVERIREAVNQLTEVLNDFLSLSQLEQGAVAHRPASLDLRALVTSCIEASEGQLRNGQRIEIAPGPTDLTIRADAKLLRHVITNLLSNAAKYSGEGQRILIELGLDDNGVASISVTDHGIGIPAEDQVHLFDRFFRARNVENVKGTGLGLNIVDHYVQLMGGAIGFSSELGVGSTFTVKLPPQAAAEDE